MLSPVKPSIINETNGTKIMFVQAALLSYGFFGIVLYLQYEYGRAAKTPHALV